MAVAMRMNGEVPFELHDDEEVDERRARRIRRRVAPAESSNVGLRGRRTGFEVVKPNVRKGADELDDIDEYFASSDEETAPNHSSNLGTSAYEVSMNPVDSSSDDDPEDQSSSDDERQLIPQLAPETDESATAGEESQPDSSERGGSVEDIVPYDDNGMADMSILQEDDTYDNDDMPADEPTANTSPGRPSPQPAGAHHTPLSTRIPLSPVAQPYRSSLTRPRKLAFAEVSPANKLSPQERRKKRRVVFEELPPTPAERSMEDDDGSIFVPNPTPSPKRTPLPPILKKGEPVPRKHGKKIHHLRLEESIDKENVENLSPSFNTEYDDNGQAVRRSRRTRIAPLKKWKNERQVYKRMGNVFVPSDVVRVEETPERKPRVPDSPLPPTPQREPLPNTASDYMFVGLRQQKEKAVVHFEHDNFSSGAYLLAPADKVKCNLDFERVFFLHYGHILVRRGKQSFHLRKEGTFFLPGGESWVIENVSLRKETRLAFVDIIRPDHDVGEEEAG